MAGAVSTGGLLGEFELIRRFFSDGSPRGLGDGVTLGIGDDAALIEPPPDCELAVTVDTIVAGRHFPLDSDPRSIGHRAMAVNLSDLAAMGATPAWATLALTLPAADAAWLEPFARGLLDLARAHGVALVGGDTTGGPLTVSVQLMGHVPRGAAMRRGGARAGDWLAVTGTLGDAGAGLALRRPPSAHAVQDHSAQALVAQLIGRFEFPAPRVHFGRLARSIAHAAMDLSDGLVGDLPKIAAASGLAAHVEVERLPLSAALRAVASPGQALDWALGAGDDYELLLAVAPARFAELAAAAGACDLGLTAIGKLQAGSGVTWSRNGEPFLPSVQGWDHFR